MTPCEIFSRAPLGKPKSRFYAKIYELVKQGAIGNLVEMESADGETLRIFVE